MVRAAYARLNERSRLRDEFDAEISLRCSKPDLDEKDLSWSFCYLLGADGVDGAIGDVIEMMRTRRRTERWGTVPPGQLPTPLDAKPTSPKQKEHLSTPQMAGPIQIPPTG
jgi:hypothetical protein